MGQVNNTYLSNYKSRVQALSSLVVNLPFEKDTFSSAPKIVKLDLAEILALIQKGIIGTFTFLFSSCIIFSCIFIPLQNQNARLLNTKKTLTNKQFSLLVKEQEASSYKKLFDSVTLLSLTEPKDIIHIRNNNFSNNNNQKSKNITKYPLIQYTGF